MSYAVKVRDGRITVFNALTGASQRTFGSKIRSAIMIDGDHIQAESTSGKTIIYRASTGAQLRSF